MKRVVSLFLFIALSLRAEESALTLSQAWKLAVADNPSLEAARLRVEQASARWRQARSSFHPQVLLSAGQSRTGLSERSLTANPLLDDPLENHAAGLNLVWTLFDGGLRRGTSSAARLDMLSADAREAAGRNQLLAAVANAFFATHLAAENLRIAESDATFQQQQMHEAQARFRAGQGSHVDVLNFQIRLNTASSSVHRAQADHLASLAGLGALLNRDVTALAPLNDQETLPVAAAGDRFNALWDYALLNLPELKAARFEIEAVQARADSASAAYAPRLQLTGAYQAEREEDFAFSGDDTSYALGLQLAVDLWDGGLRRGRLDEARAAGDAARAQYQQVLLDARAELQAALTHLQDAEEQVRLQRETHELSRENRALVEKAYAAGRESLLRLNEAQRDLVNAESRLALSVIQLHASRIRVEQACGALLSRVPTEP